MPARAVAALAALTLRHRARRRVGPPSRACTDLGDRLCFSAMPFARVLGQPRTTAASHRSTVVPAGAARARKRPGPLDWSPGAFPFLLLRLRRMSAVWHTQRSLRVPDRAGGQQEPQDATAGRLTLIGVALSAHGPLLAARTPRPVSQVGPRVRGPERPIPPTRHPGGRVSRASSCAARAAAEGAQARARCTRSVFAGWISCPFFCLRY